jgi:hypothetical protein
MKRWTLPLVFIAAGLLAASSSYAANDACYTWNCNPSTHVCSFNASCSTTTDGSLWRYRWDFGDGSGYHFDSDATITKTIGVPYPWVNLTIFFFGANEVSVTCQITVFDNVGPPIGPYSGTCN